MTVTTIIRRDWIGKMREQLKSKVLLCGVAILVFWIIVAIFAYLIAPYPQQGLNGIPNPAQALRPPSWQHLFGTTELGLDLFSRVIFGTRIALFTAAVVTGASLLIGYPLGVIAGYVGGSLDEGLMRITDVFLAFPTILMAILIVAAIHPSLWSMILALSVTRWPQYVRLSRAQALSLRTRNFVLAAKGMGEGRFEIIRKHIAINAIPPVLILATTDFGFIILADAGLSFLGLGVTPPTADWGLTIAQSIAYFPVYWWYATFPGIALFTLVTAFALIGDVLTERLDPKLAKMTGVWSKL
ncbi:MAG TPA: ABC transporter permease [Nitrososphaerales archaeon]|nr:ABC transporter permease [Nitrososphaerales archaeon]